MSQSTGPLSRDEFEGVNGVVLPNEVVGDMVLNFFIDLKEEVIFILIQGGIESAYFHHTDDIYHIENLNMVGVMLEDYVEALNHIIDPVKDEHEQDPLPPVSQLRNSLLTRAKVKRSQHTN